MNALLADSPRNASMIRASRLRQCFIGKTVNALPVHQDNIHPLLIPTIHYIGEKMFDTHGNPDKKIIFLITACEMTLEMFGDWGTWSAQKASGYA